MNLGIFICSPFREKEYFGLLRGSSCLSGKLLENFIKHTSFIVLLGKSASRSQFMKMRVQVVQVESMIVLPTNIQART